MTPIVSIAASTIASLAQGAAKTLVQTSPSVATGDAAGAGASFGDVMQDFAVKTIDSLKSGEAAALAGVEGKVPTQQVVSAVMQAERDLQTAIALRDKAVAAYQEISRMAI
ncbi:MAG: flagellar hook-basal body protein FliE [Methylocystis sp.]|nr:MAG: flagellar hook-basal body protein FliE [Methylocystis sp.]